jgi:hypothetical protein
VKRLTPPHPSPHRLTALTALLAAPLFAAAPARADVLDLIGYRDLVNRPDTLPITPGTGVPVAQVEVPTANTNDYTPDTSATQFAGKQFTNRSGTPSGTSGHATMVATLFYGNTSAAPGVSDVALFSAQSFLDGLLRTGRASRAPGRVGATVVNNSWIAGYASDSANVEAVRRLDDLINRDDVLVFNAVGNTPADPFPKLLATSYNGVSVGTPTGSVGPVAFDSPAPRIKPDLIVNAGTTSEATAVASGAGALLRSVAIYHDLPAGELAIKSILMASADRDAGWLRGRPTGKDNAASPLDFAQGAGQLRVDQAYDVLTAGQQPAGTAAPATAGWDYARTPRARHHSVTYTIHVDDTLPTWDAVLTWNRVIAAGQSDGSYSTEPTTPDFDLALYRNKRGGRRLLAYSNSPADNVESLQLADLPAGDYQLVLNSDYRTYYALAWYADPNGATPVSTNNLTAAIHPAALGAPGAAFAGAAVPEPTTLLWLAPLTLLTRRRRRARITQ